jgi:3-oxoacyl-[acyl-carrier protein] reductase
VMRVNLTSAFLLGQRAARAMTRQGGGRIVNIGSISGQRGSEGRSAYGTSKAGLMHLTRAMAVELAPAGIAVNAISPGPVETDLTQHATALRKAYLDRIPAAGTAHPKRLPRPPSSRSRTSAKSSPAMCSTSTTALWMLG